MKSDNGSLHIGIIGCGKVAAEHHLPSLRKIKANVIAVADCEINRAEDFARRFAIPYHYGSAAELLANPDIDAVGVLTHTPSHCEIGTAVLDSGKHLFMEKPLALSKDQCDQLVRLSEQTGLKSMICFNLRFHRLIERAKAFIDAGNLGTIKAIQSSYTHYRNGKDAPYWHRTLSSGGGVTFNESIHHIDLWCYLTGQNISEVMSYHNPSAFYEDETSIIAARMTGGILATMNNTFNTSPTNEIEIQGEKGRLQLCLYKADGMTFIPYDSYPGSISLRLKNTLRSIPMYAGGIGSISRGGSFGETFCFAWQNFIDSALNNKDPKPSLANGHHAVMASLAALEAAASGYSISVQS